MAGADEPMRSAAPVFAGLRSNALVPSVGGTETRIVVPGEATAGAYAVWWNECAPGSGPPRHIHHREDEIIHVLDGKLLIWVAGAVHEVAPGDTASLPRGIAHTFRVVSAAPARLLVTVVPGGFERFFAAMQGLVMPRDRDEAARISGGFGLETVGPPLEG